MQLLPKCSAPIRILAYGVLVDGVDECLRIGESTTIECLKVFRAGVIQMFGKEYLRDQPIQVDDACLLQVVKACDFLDML